MRKITLLFLLINCIHLNAQVGAFITTWDTQIPGFTDANSIQIPTAVGETYNYTVDWGDGTVENFTTDVPPVHTYANPGIVTISITGDFPRILASFDTDIDKLLTVEQWGDIAWTSMERAFNGGDNLDVVATDAPDLSNVTSMIFMFSGCRSLQGNAAFNTWDVSSVEDMNQTFAFTDTFNTDLNNWNTSQVTNMFAMFGLALVFNGDISTWDTSQVTNMGAMFTGANAFNGDISTWDTSNVEIMERMFNDLNGGGSVFNSDISTWNTNQVTQMQNMFNGAIAFDQNLETWDISALTDASNMFFGVTLSIDNYDALLNGWGTLDAGETQIPSNITFSAGNSNFCLGEPGRDNLTDNFGWTITDLGIDCSALGGPIFTSMDTVTIEENTTQVITVQAENAASQTITYAFNGGDDDSLFNLDTNTGVLTFITAPDFETPQDNDTDNVYNLVVRATDPGGLSIDQNLAVTVTDVFDTPLGDFVTTWNTQNPGISDANSITIPTSAFGETYNYTVDWGDGTIETFTTNTPPTHTYASPGIVTVRITGDFSRILFFGTTDNQKILTVEQWGDIPWQSMDNAFRDAINLQVNATDAPNLSNTFSLTSMFIGCTSLTGNTSFNTWDTSNITQMNFMFNSAVNFSADIGNWDTSQVFFMDAMFFNADAFNADISGWDTGNVLNMFAMFADAAIFNSDISGWNTGNVNNMRAMFELAPSFNADISGWNTTQVTDMGFMFNGANAFNSDISGWNTTQVIDMGFMFQDANAFNSDISAWDTGNVTTMQQMFTIINGGGSVFNADISNWDTSNVTTTFGMFFGAENFDQNIGAWDISSLTNADFMFNNNTLSLENYDALLNGWSTLDAGETQIPSNITFTGSTNIYCLGEPGRDNLIDNFGWTITDGGLDCSTLSVNDFVFDDEVKMFPNPASNNVNIDFGIINTVQRINLYDISGRLITSEDVNQSNISIPYTLDISSFNSGNYIVQIISSDGQTLQKKLIIE